MKGRGRRREIERKPKKSKLQAHEIDYKNVELLNKFTSSLGAILPRSITGLSAKVQRKVTKSVNRARALGIMPFLAK